MPVPPLSLLRQKPIVSLEPKMSPTHCFSSFTLQVCCWLWVMYGFLGSNLEKMLFGGLSHNPLSHFPALIAKNHYIRHSWPVERIINYSADSLSMQSDGCSPCRKLESDAYPAIPRGCVKIHHVVNTSFDTSSFYFCKEKYIQLIDKL